MSIYITKKTTGTITLPNSIIRITKEWKKDWDSISGMATGIAKNYAIYNRNFLHDISKSKTINALQAYDLYLLAKKNIKDEQDCNKEDLDKLTAFFPEPSKLSIKKSAIELEASKVLKFIDRNFKISH